MDLEALIQSFKRNNLKAQSQLYQRYKDDLYVLCLKYCKNMEDAQDNLHDAFMEIFTNLHKYKAQGSFEGWMKRITINKAIDKYKRNSEINIIINDDILEDPTIESETLNLPLKQLLGLIQALPNQYRLVFNLFEMDNYSHKEIAELLSISEGTSKSNLNRAKHILKGKILQINASNPNKFQKYGH